MTEAEFRATPSLRDKLATLMQDEALQEALAAVKSKGELMSIPSGLSGIDVGMILASRNTRAVIVHELLEMTRPPDEPPTEALSPDYGTGFTVDQFDNPPVKSKTP